MKELTITIHYADGRMQLHLPAALLKMSVANLKKVFRLLLENTPWFEPNEKTVQVLDEYLPAWKDDNQEAWRDASREYQMGWQDEKYGGYSKDHLKEIKAENRRLTTEVKQAEKAFEKADKLLTAWAASKDKYLN